MKVPYFSSKDIKLIADEFRSKYWNEVIPVDVEKIAEHELNIKIIPIPDLKKLASVDALITSKWDIVFADEFFYSNRENRFRFSLAHELGHFILHKEIYESFEIKNLEDYNNFFDDMTSEDYSFFERQANNFANYLLIPTDKLKEEIKNIIREDDKYKIFKEEESKINYLSCSLCDQFKVSEASMTIAIKNLINIREIEL
ncbi:MAG: ImmA/IrrE family metallo-endopeptidase [Candidatus Paceibacterota bacterium]|jgi:Zn-dependent peptidase ImmA (M78 family)